MHLWPITWNMVSDYKITCREMFVLCERDSLGGHRALQLVVIADAIILVLSHSCHVTVNHMKIIDRTLKNCRDMTSIYDTRMRSPSISVVRTNHQWCVGWLNHCGLMKSHSVMKLCQNWYRHWLVACRNQAITLNNAGLLSIESFIRNFRDIFNQNLNNFIQ